MRSTITCLILGWALGWALAMAGLVSCFRVPVQVVQYQDEAPVTVAPVGTAYFSASQAVMNPRVMDPVNVGPLPPKPDPVSPGLDWLSMLLGAGLLLIPELAVVKVLVDRVRRAVAVGAELVGKIQEVKAAHPAAKESINETLAKNQSEEARKFVEKVKKNKTKSKETSHV